MKRYYCCEINENILDKKIILCGWINNKRIFRSIVFIEFKDISGILQLVCYKNNIYFENICKLKNECCIQVYGIVKNKKRIIEKSSIFEIEIDKINLLGNSKKLPINFNKNLSEYQKLKYRYLYLRNKNSFEIFKLKSDINWYIHKFMKMNNFLNIETPILSKNFKYEGSRNYVVPSRIYNNKFYSLSQSPQLFKQILMISGFDKYYQIAKCFRDEDLRSNRQPEFTQIDIEISFKNEKYIYYISEKLIKYIFKNIYNTKFDYKFKKITFKESIEKFGTDKPDLRSLLEIFNINNLLNIDVKYILDIIYIPNGISINNLDIYINSFKFKNNIFLLKFNKLSEFIYKLGLNINNVLYNKILNHILNKTKNINNDLILIYIINKKFYSSILISKLRTEIGLKLKYKNFSFVWIVDFPMFKINKYGNIESMHHPFTLPKKKNDFIKNKINKKNIMSSLSRSYDLVVNGCELASGSVRINNRKLQELIFNILNISKNDQKKFFGFLLKALEYGAPPHLGIAFGLDRLIMLITNINNIKDVIAFPKTSSSYDPMTNSPN